MFSATAHQVAKALGKDTLLPVSSLNTADNVEIFRLVIKKRRKWLFFTQKPQYETTEFSLSDILTDTDDEIKSLHFDTHELTTYNSQTNFSLKGKFGADISKELLDIGLGTTDSVIVISQLGTLLKSEICTPRLLALLQNKKLQLSHPIVSNAILNKRKSLGIITSVIHLKDSAKISSKIDLDGSFTLDSKPLGLEDSGEVSADKCKSMTIPENTSIAFSMYELLVSLKDGAFQLMLSSDEEGGFIDEDITDGLQQDLKPDDLINLLINNKEKTEICDCILNLISVPQNISALKNMFEECEMSLDWNISTRYTISDLYEEFYLKLTSTTRKFLELAEFQIKDEEICLPNKDSLLFQAFFFLLTLLDDLDDNLLSIIIECVKTTTILSVMQKLVDESKSSIRLQRDEIDILAKEPYASLMLSLNLKVDKNQHEVQVTRNNHLQIKVVYYILKILINN